MIELTQRGFKITGYSDSNRTSGYHVHYVTFSNSITNTVPYDINIDGYFPKDAMTTINFEMLVSGVYVAGTTYRYVCGSKSAYIYTDASNYLQIANQQGTFYNTAGTVIYTPMSYNNVSASYGFSDGSYATGAFRLINVGGVLYLRLYNSSSPAVGSLTSVVVCMNWIKV